MYPFRAFVCYAHEDYELAADVVRRLAALGLDPSWDRVIGPGQRFPEVIRTRIARSHLFVPLLTPKSAYRPWVHQETGFAMGVDVPVVPLSVGSVPEQMIRDLKAVTLGPDLAELAEAFRASNLDAVVRDATKTGPARYECADHPERRTQVMVAYAGEVRALDRTGRIRMQGAYTSFALPKVSPPHASWTRRDGDVQRSPYYHELQWKERSVLEEHAKVSGCDLVIDPTIGLAEIGPDARRCRLETLRAFIVDESVPDVRVVVRTRSNPGNLILVGDWFVAESVSPQGGVGYRQTTFTWHAPTVLSRLRAFDVLFEQMFDGMDGPTSRRVALDAIDAVLATIPA